MPIIVGSGTGPVGLATFNSKAWLRQQISKHIDERNIYVGSATANGTTTTLISSELSAFPDDHWKGGELLTISGTASNIGYARRVSAFTKSSGTLTTAAFPASTGSSDGFEVRKSGPYADPINQAINEAIQTVFNYAFVEMVDTSILFNATGNISGGPISEYTIPAGFVYIYDVQVESAIGVGDWSPLPLTHWRIVRGPTPKLSLTSAATGSLINAAPLRLLGYRQPNLLIADTDIPEVPTPYLIAYSMGQLLGNFAGGPATDPDAHVQRQSWWAQKAGVERQLAQLRLRPNSRRVRF